MTTDSDITRQLDAWLAEYGGPGVRVGEALCDRHPGDAAALHYEDAAGRRESLTFAELAERSARLAGALAEAGVGPGDRVATLLPKSPELLVTLLALWRRGAAQVPLFTAFGPDAVSYRVRSSGAKVLVTDVANRPKLEADARRDVQRVLTVTAAGEPPPPGDTAFAQALETAAPAPQPAAYDGDDLLILLYTSGTTGNPKGVAVPVRALASFHAYMHYAIDLRPTDVYWNVADPGWGYGLWYGLIGPLLLGHATLLRNAPFDAEGTYDTLLRRQVSNLAAAPTVFRALRAAGVPDGFRERSALRAVSSAGEPLNPEVLTWSQAQLGVAVHDHYGQSELGMVVANHHHPALARPLRGGSMGQPFPGYRMVVVDEQGREAPPGVDGEFACDVESSPLYWFRGYHADPERTAERFARGPRYYLTGDAAHVDPDGYVHFASRADDVISTAGYRLGPFEVESALMTHPAVGEAAVIGTPDPLRGEAVTAYVVLSAGHHPSEALAEQLQDYVKTRLAKHAYPRHIRFVEALPKTASGKVQRGVLRRRWAEAETPAGSTR